MDGFDLYLHVWGSVICEIKNVYGNDTAALATFDAKLMSNTFIMPSHLFDFHYEEGLIQCFTLRHRGEVRTTRLTVLPWHVFLGLYTYGLAVVTAETGLLEKLTLLQIKGNVLKRCPESAVVNGLGLGLALLSSVVILTAVSPKYQASKSKIISDSKNSSL
ncbi:UNVERIFIED_CONTAM: putative transmembrane ascorbate ferrireductase 4 [Sesamum radiatum]|uniref:Transmembrane ascorbate ferrireductase 4 n=1 Tax=Sesamum radiatum TaxID=300843 RepID=A0AAW2V731_SESRA